MATHPSLTDTQRLTALRLIESALRREEHPKLRACGLTEGIAQAVANEGLVEFWLTDEGSYLDQYRVDSLTPKGLGILALADVAEPSPLRVRVEPRHESIWSKIFRSTRSGLWDLVKIGVGAVIGWFLKKHFP